MSFNLIRIEKSITDEIGKKGFTLDQKGITNWLKEKNLIFPDETLISFHDIQPWKRAGGETYSTIFEYRTNKKENKIFVKAIVTINPEKNLNSWINRRSILSLNNIPVSHWFWTGEATIYECFYPHKVSSIKNFNSLIEIAFTLDKLGFSTLNFLDDILCDKDGNPYYDDFGFDLGDPSQTIKTTSKEYLLKNFPNRYNEIETFYNLKS